MYLLVSWSKREAKKSKRPAVLNSEPFLVELRGLELMQKHREIVHFLKRVAQNPAHLKF